MASRRPKVRGQQGDDREYYTPGEVARMFGVTTRTVANWCDKGILQSVATLGGQRRIIATSIKGGQAYDAKLESFAQRMESLRAGAPVPSGEEIARAVRAARHEATQEETTRTGESDVRKTNIKVAGEEARQHIKKVIRSQTSQGRGSRS